MGLLCGAIGDNRSSYEPTLTSGDLVPIAPQISAFVSQALPRMLVTSTDFQAGRYSAAMATCFPACNAQLAASVGAATASSGCTGVCAWLMAEPAPPVVAAPAAADGGPGGAPYGNGAGPYGQVKLYVANLGDSRCVLGAWHGMAWQQY